MNAAFAPSEAELAWARRIVEAYEAAAREGRGAVALDGEMIDLPVVERARRLLAEDGEEDARWQRDGRGAEGSGAGRFYEDFEVGDVFRSRLGRTVTQTDNIWFTCLTLNTNQIHFNDAVAERTRFGKPLVNSAFTLALITGMTVPDTSENAAANLAVDGHQAAEPGLRRRHALGRERDPRDARVDVEPERRASSRCAAAASTSAARS